MSPRPVLVAVLALLTPSLLLAGSATPRTNTPVDRATIHAGPVAGAPLVVRLFSSEGADLGGGASPKNPKKHAAAQQLTATAPRALADSLKAQIEAKGSFASVTILEDGAAPPEGALVLDGRFTALDPGSRGARYWVGFGAGRSRVCVHATVSDPAGTALVELDHCRSGNLGWFGGKAEGMMYTDVAGTAEKLTLLLDGWARGTIAP